MAEVRNAGYDANSRERGIMAGSIDAGALRQRIIGDDELAILDVREEGVFADGHLLFASSLPLSRLELAILDLVPRPSAPVVLCDGGDGLARRAAEILARFGYDRLSILDGGVAAWQAAGFELFTGVFVPSKAFGEFVEQRFATPSISAAELKAKLDAGDDLVVLDSRPFEEYRRMSIPGGVDVPGAELAYRVHDIAPDPATQVVVNCAGRTRSIIGAQSLINAGIANPVVALRNGTMGWDLAGYGLDRGMERRAPEISPAGLGCARAAAATVARRFGVATIDAATLEAWKAERHRRTLYLFDVRNPEEYDSGHLPGSVPAPGGQLVQATDRYAATRNARVVLVDDTGVRATMTASWLIQMGWPEVAVLTGGLDGDALEAGRRSPPVAGLEVADAEAIAVDALARLVARDRATVVDLAPSRDYRGGHIPGAWFAVRARLAAALARIPAAERLVFTSADGTLARLAASEAAPLTEIAVACLAGGTAAWRAAGHALAEGEEHMADVADDVWLRPYDRTTGVQAAANEYLSWELALGEQIERDATARFRYFPG